MVPPALAVITTFAACVSDGAGPIGKVDAGPGVSDAAPSKEDASAVADVEVPCPEFYGECDVNSVARCETDLRSSSEHCGACGRSCDGVVCKDGECANEKLVDTRSQPVSFLAAGGRIVWLEGLEIHGCLYSNCASGSQILVDVNGNAAQPSTLPTGSVNPHLLVTDGTDFFFSQCASNSNFDCAMVSCPLGGCKGTGPTFLTTERQTRRPYIVVNGGTKAGEPGLFVYHTLDGFVRYTPPLKPNATTVGYAPAPDTEVIQAVHMGAANFIWVDSNTSQANPDGGMYTCPVGGCGANRVKLLPPPVKHLSVVKGAAFSSYGNAAASSIVSCALTGCNQTGDVLAKDQAYVSDIVADENAVYWTTTGTATPATNSVAGGQVMMCSLPGCKGGPKRIADTQVNPMSLALDGNYVYWMNRGAPLPAKTGSIWRRRR